MSDVVSPSLPRPAGGLSHVLSPWPRVAVPHDDILGSDFDLSTYAANLGDVDAGAEKCPVVYRDPVAFYQATYLTRALDELLRDVSAVLAGGAGNRVLQLRTPFGGGKTHTLIALLHLARSRAALAGASLLGAWPDPGPTRVAVLPCMDLSAASGRKVEGVKLQTLWGELAWRIGGAAAYEAVAEDDRRRSKPGTGALKRILDGPPTLVLLDEVLSYVEAALAVPTGDSNLGRQTMLFLQDLTDLIRGLPRCAVVYSLQQSVRQAVGDEGLLEMLDGLVSRVDAKKEPVSGDEVLRVVQRRLFKDLGDPAVRERVATEYASLMEGFLAAEGQSEAEKRSARERAQVFAGRVLDAYPFHPELLDLMYHRWGSLPSYQRTRGALQFLATVIGAVRKAGDAAGPLIGPGDVPLDDPMVRNTFFSQVGEREAMKSVLDSDLIGTSARCRRVDDAVAGDAPALALFRPGTRLTRALALYSFGAKPGEDRGVVRSDLLLACQVPGLPADILDVALQGLSENLLYIHGAGRRFRFEKRPNLNKLIDDAIRTVPPHEARDAIRADLEARIGGRAGFALWPADSSQVPDRRPRFQVAFLGPEYALKPEDELVRLCREWTDNCGGGKRIYRNAIAFGLPSAQQADKARDAARRLLAIDGLLSDRRRHGFEPDDVEDLEKRKRRASDELQVACRQLYPVILLPVSAPRDASDPIRMERFDIQTFQAFGAGILDGIHKVLENWVFTAAVPSKLIACTHLGEGEPGTRSHWISGPELTDQFFGSVQYPKLLTLEGLKETVAKGVSRGHFGYVMGGREADGKLVATSKDALTWNEEATRDDIDLSAGSFIVSKTWAEEHIVKPPPPPPKPPIDPPIDPPVIPPVVLPPVVPPPVVTPPDPKKVVLEFRAKGGQLFQAFGPLVVLSDWAQTGFVAHVTIVAQGDEPMDRNLYETAVVMSLDEEGIEVLRK